MTEGLKSEALFLKSIFLRKSLRVVLRQPTSLYKGGCFPQKDGRRVRVSPNKFIYTKKHKGKILVLFLAQKERLDGFSTRRVRFANSLFYVPFCSAKRWTKSSSLSKQIHIYKKKKHKEKILVLFLAQKERLELSRRLPDLRP